MNIEELNTQLEYLDETKGLIKQAIIDKGQSISENDTFRSFVQKINDIETGVETANIPIWYVNSSVSMTDLISHIIAEKISLPYFSFKTDYTRADGYDVSRLKPEIGDFVIYSGDFTSPYDSSENKSYIFLGQILTQQEEFDPPSYTGNLQIISACGLDEFNTSIGILSNNIKAGTTILGVQGKSTVIDTECTGSHPATANDLLQPYTAFINGQEILGNVVDLRNSSGTALGNSIAIHSYVQYDSANNDIVEHTYNSYNLQDVAIAKAVEMDITIPGSGVAEEIGLTADKLKKNETILGITGTLEEGIDTSDATAVASDIAEGKTAYVNGQKITGTVTLYGDQAAQSYQPIYYVTNDADIQFAPAAPQFGIMEDRIVLRLDDIPDPVLLRPGTDVVMQAHADNLISNIGLTADKIKQGETIMNITGTYTGETMKEYASETAMNNDIANIQEGEIVKVVASGTTTYYIKETTMKKLVKEEDTISPEEYEENIDLADNILGNASIDGNELSVSGTVVGNELEVNGTVVGNELEL